MNLDARIMHKMRYQKKIFSGKNIQLYQYIFFGKIHFSDTSYIYDIRQMNLTTMQCDGFDFSWKPQ